AERAAGSKRSARGTRVDSMLSAEGRRGVGVAGVVTKAVKRAEAGKSAPRLYFGAASRPRLRLPRREPRPHPQLLHRRTHRPREVHAGRPSDRGDGDAPETRNEGP